MVRNATTKPEPATVIVLPPRVHGRPSGGIEASPRRRPFATNRRAIRAARLLALLAVGAVTMFGLAFAVLVTWLVLAGALLAAGIAADTLQQWRNAALRAL